MDEGSELSRGLESVTRGTFVMFLASIAFIAETFAWRVVLVRALSPDDWSVFALGLAYAGLFTTLGRFGLGRTVARNLPHASSDAERRGIVRLALALGAATASGASVLLFLVANLLGARLGSPDLTVALELFAISVGFTVFAFILASIFQGYEDVRPNAYFIQVANPVLFLAFVAVLGVTPSVHLTLRNVLVAYVLASIGTLAATVVYALRRLRGYLPSGHRRVGVFRPTVALAVPLLVVAAAYYLAGTIDTLVLGLFEPLAVGTYAASLAMARLLPVGVTALSFIFLPVAAKYHRLGDYRSMETLYATSTKWIQLASLPFFLVFACLPGPSLRLVYGPQYSSVILPLRILVTGAFVSTLAGPSVSAQIAFADRWLLLVNAVLAAIVDLGLALWLVPTFGMTGAAVAWATASALYPGLSLAEIALLHGVNPFRNRFLVPVVLTALPLGVLFLMLPTSLPIWLLPLFAITALFWFIGAVILTRNVDDGDRQLLRVVEGVLGTRLNLVRRMGTWSIR